MKNTTRNYCATFIIDNRGKEDSVEKFIDGFKKEIETVGGKIAKVENIGRKEFARVTDKEFPGAPYVEITFAAEPAAPAQLKERLKLDGTIYRLFIKSV